MFKTQKFDNSFINRRMETQTSLIRADRAVKLYAETAVDLNLTLVIHPRYAEFDDAFRLYQHFNHAALNEFRIFFYNRLQRFQNLMHSLMKFRFCGIPFYNPLHQFGQIRIFKSHYFHSPPCFFNIPRIIVAQNEIFFNINFIL